MSSIFFPLFILVIVVLAVIVLVAVFGALRPTPQEKPPHNPEVRAVITSSQRRAGGAIALAVGLLIAMVSLGFAVPWALGVPLAVAPTVAASGGLLFYAFPGQRGFRVPENSVRSASLEPRSPWALARHPSVWLPAGTALGLTLFLVFTGVTASSDEFGRSRSITVSTPFSSSGASPYPGWFYGAPILLGVALLLASTFIALHRISKIPAFPLPELAEIDRKWRLGSTRIVSAISGTGLLVTWAGVMLIAGNALHSVNSGADGSASGAAAGMVFTILGMVAFIASMVAITLAALWATTLKKQVTALGTPSAAVPPISANPYTSEPTI